MPPSAVRPGRPHHIARRRFRSIDGDDDGISLAPQLRKSWIFLSPVAPRGGNKKRKKEKEKRIREIVIRFPVCCPPDTTDRKHFHSFADTFTFVRPIFARVKFHGGYATSPSPVVFPSRKFPKDVFALPSRDSTFFFYVLNSEAFLMHQGHHVFLIFLKAPLITNRQTCTRGHFT